MLEFFFEIGKLDKDLITIELFFEDENGWEINTKNILHCVLTNVNI